MAELKNSQMHCMHDVMNTSPKERCCCWCGMLQQPAYERDDAHGPHIPQQWMPYHWEPSSLVACPMRQMVAV